MNKEYATMWESMKQLVETMSGSSDEDTKYPAVQTELEELRQKIEKAEQRIETAENQQNGGEQ